MLKSPILLLALACLMVLQACKKEKLNLDVDDNYDVVIVGGGLSGLTAGFELKDKKILVLEKNDIAGGRIRSGNWEGLHYPKGTEYMGEPDSDQAKFFDKLGLQTIKIPPPTDGIAYQKQIYYAENVFGFMNPETQSQLNMLDAEFIRLNDDFSGPVWDNQEELPNYAAYDGISMEEWLQANGYDPLIRQYFNVENRGLFGASSSELSFLFNTVEMAYNIPGPEDAHTS